MDSRTSNLKRVVVITALLFTREALAEDVVILSSSANPRARLRIKGEVIEYTGRSLVVRQADGREIKRPGRQVVKIETEWPAGKAEADRLFDEQQFDAAREKYVAAAHKETRSWARRELIARLIACHRELKQFDAAGKLFLALVHEDPATPYFAEMPLAWSSAALSPTLDKTTHQWLKNDAPLEQLLGASHLLSTNDRQQAYDVLTRLSTEKDDRINALAEAQVWRAIIPTADTEQLAAWERRVEAFPEALRAGPYFVLGRALAQHGELDRAILALLHTPILYPQARTLAADSLLAAAELLEQQNHRPAAQQLRRELAAHYPQSAAAEAVKPLLGPVEQVPSALGGPEPGVSLEPFFLAALRSRRLFALAEQHCRRRLGSTGLNDAARVDMAIELSRTLVEHALNEAPAEREPLWGQALSAARNGDAESLNGSRRLLIDAQAAIVHLAHGELARQEAELAGGDVELLDSARKELRAAVAAFDEVSKAMAAEQRKAEPARRADIGSLSADDLFSLARDVGYQLARAFRNQGQSYPPESADRTNSLRQAVERLRLLAATDVDDAVTLPARLDEIVCLRLLGDLAAAEARLNKLAEARPPMPVSASIEAERIRLALDRRRLNDAVSRAERALGGDQRTADLDYACLEAYLAAWHAAAKAGDAGGEAEWQDKAAALIGEIDERFGPYWSRRAELLLAGSVTRGGDTQNLVVLVRAAESLYRSGQLTQAREAYDRAAKRAAQSQEADAAFDHAFTAAAISQQLDQNADAARRFRSLALAEPKQARAGEAHLLAIYNTALAAQRDAGEGLPAYLDLLNEHLYRWPRASTASQVRLWLAVFFERERRWSDAIEAYQGVPPDDLLAQSAVEGLARAYQRWLAQRAAAAEPTAEIAERGARYFEKLVVNARGGLPERFSQIERIAATAAATLWLEYSDTQFEKAQRLLSAALAGSDDAPDDWRSTAQTLQVFAVAAQGHRERAAQLLDEISGGEPTQRLVLIERLDKLAANAPPAVAGELAELELRAGQMLESRLDELPVEQRRDFQRAYVRALSAANRHDDALRAARALAEAFPRDGRVQEDYAELLLGSHERANWQTALKRWRDISRKTPQGSERWLRSMYGQALALSRLGEKQQAQRLVRFTEAVSPNLGGPELEAKFRELGK